MTFNFRKILKKLQRTLTYMKPNSSDLDDALPEFRTLDKNEDAMKEENVYFRTKFMLLLGLILIGVIGVLTQLPFYGSDSSECRSIYMYPSYGLVNGFDQRYNKLAQKYHLYIYREQGLDKGVEDGKIHLTGIPVLYIPGNSGSYKQVRSVAAAAASKYYRGKGSNIKNERIRNLDFFAVDFNEDLTAFHGQTLIDQAEYSNDAIKYILRLYESSEAYKKTGDPLPESVIIIGHSMGGVVARFMTMLRNHVPYSINTILTLSSPHAVAPVTFDSEISKIYRKLNTFWGTQFLNDTSFYSTNVSVFSITGGISDTVLPADYAAIESIIPLKNGFTVATTTIPRVWTTIDHLAIVWCDQLRSVLTDFLFEILDYSSPYKVQALEKRMSVAKSLLLSGLEDSLPKTLNSGAGDTHHIIFEPKDGELKVLDSKARIIINEDTYESTPKYVSYSIPTDTENCTFSLLSTIEEPEVLLCRQVLFTNERISYNCSTLLEKLISVPRSTKDISSLSRSSVGGDKDPFKMLYLEGELLSLYDMVVLTKPQKTVLSDSGFLAAELSNINAVETINKNVFDLLFSGFRQDYNSASSPMVSHVKFPQLKTSLVSYGISFKISGENHLFEPFFCQAINSPFETKWHINLSKPAEISFISEAPYVPRSTLQDGGMRLTFIIPPGSGINFKLRINWLRTFKLLFIRYRMAATSFPLMLVSLVLAYQFSIYTKTEIFLPFDKALNSLIYNHLGKMMIMALILTPLSNVSAFNQLLDLMHPMGANKLFSENNILGNCYYLGTGEIFMSWLGPMLLIMTIALVYLLHYPIILLGYLWRFFLLKFANRVLGKTGKLRGPKALSMRQVSVATFLMLLVLFYIPYQFAFMIIAAGQLNLTIKLNSIRDKASYSNLKNYNSSLLMLFLFLIILNMPVVIIFLHNIAIDWKTPFSSHHNFLAVLPILLIVVNNSLLKMPSPKIDGFSQFLIIFGFLYLSFFSLLYGVTNLYWIHHIFNIICGFLFLTTIVYPI